jgi:alanine racemase
MQRNEAGGDGGSTPALDSADGTTRAGRLNEAVVDLAAIAQNTRLFRDHTRAAMMAVVKAEGFGHGAVPVARTALEHGASWLGVSYIEEALALRAAGIEAPVLAWIHLPQEDFTAALTADIDLSVSTREHLDAIAHCAERAGVVASVHLKVDTGLHRNGACTTQWPALVAAAAQWERRGAVRVRGIWSHLVHPDEPMHATTGQQIERFDAAVREAEAAGLHAELRHLANSAAALAAPETHYDLVRLGIGLYGIEPVRDRSFGLRPAMELRGRVIATRGVGAGEGVAYGHAYTTERPTTLALLPVGYADGVPRGASGNAWITAAGERCPIAGWISMDQCVVDVGSLPVGVGQEMIVFGPGDHGEPTVVDWAGWAGTIAHEVLTGIGSRVPRRYIPAEAAPAPQPTPVQAQDQDQAQTRADRRTRVAVLFGGPGGEYEISCASAAGVATHLDRDSYQVRLVRITPEARWVTGPTDLPGGSYVAPDLERLTEAGPDDTAVDAVREAARVLGEVDVVLPTLHGPYGEDGTVQALMDTLGVPYVGSGMAASALCMDKDLAKRVLLGSGLPVAPWAVLTRPKEELCEADRDRLGLPVFVKPASAGSSVGVTRVSDWDELEDALAAAREFGEKVLVEQAVVGREVDIAVLEHPDGRLEAGPPLEIELHGGQSFFDYEAKYRDATTGFVIPARLEPETTAELQRLAVRAFELIGCSGLARVDFLLRGGTEPVFNEINTFPGFTAASQFPKIFRAAGVSYPQLLDLLIETALTKARA